MRVGVTTLAALSMKIRRVLKNNFPKIIVPRHTSAPVEIINFGRSFKRILKD